MIVVPLYVDPRGPYPALTNRALDERHDARQYIGPHPVVAHPPCGPWGALRHQYQGDEHDCAPRAVEQVRALGGVLEHPAGSKLWGALGLPAPCDPHEGVPSSDAYGGYTIEVNQVEWGHVARKPTWLYLVRVPRDAITPPPYPGRAPSHWCSGSRTNKGGGSVPNGIKVCSAQQRRRTPLAFALWLMNLASRVRAPHAYEVVPQLKPWGAHL